MTLIEILIVVSLISMLSLALYNAFSNGIRVWDKSQRLVVEEDIAIFFDKLSRDLRNTYSYSKINFVGADHRFTFPSRVLTLRGLQSGHDYIEQLGSVEYFYDFNEDAIFRRQANYGQSLSDQFDRPQLLVSSVDHLKFRYFYLTDDGEIFSLDALEGLPIGIEIEVQFSDNQGQRIVRKFIDILVEA